MARNLWRCKKTGKVIQPSLLEAMDKIVMLTWLSGEPEDSMDAYYCKFCHGWHIGHNENVRRWAYSNLKKRKVYK